MFFKFPGGMMSLSEKDIGQSRSLLKGLPRRRERLRPPFRSHGRLAQLPENRSSFVGGNEAAFVSLSFQVFVPLMI